MHFHLSEKIKSSFKSGSLPSSSSSDGGVRSNDASSIPPLDDEKAPSIDQDVLNLIRQYPRNLGELAEFLYHEIHRPGLSSADLDGLGEAYQEAAHTLYAMEDPRCGCFICGMDTAYEQANGKAKSEENPEKYVRKLGIPPRLKKLSVRMARRECCRIWNKCQADANKKLNQEVLEILSQYPKDFRELAVHLYKETNRFQQSSEDYEELGHAYSKIAKELYAKKDPRTGYYAHAAATSYGYASKRTLWKSERERLDNVTKGFEDLSLWDDESIKKAVSDCDRHWRDVEPNHSVMEELPPLLLQRRSALFYPASNSTSDLN